MTADPTEIFRERLKTAREAKKITQADLAEKTGLPASSISLFEKGPRKPSFDNLRTLASALDVTTDYLLGTADSPTNPQILLRRASTLDAKSLEFLNSMIDVLEKKSKE